MDFHTSACQRRGRTSRSPSPFTDPFRTEPTRSLRVPPRRRRRALAAGLAVLAGLTVAGKVSAEASSGATAPSAVRGLGAAGVVPGAYIVVLRSPSSGLRTASVDAATVGIAAG